MYSLKQSARVRGSAGEPLPTVFRSLAAAGVVFRRGELVLVSAGPGCLAADTEITVNRAGNGKRIRIDELVSLFNGEALPAMRYGHPTKGTRTWDPAIDTYVQCEEDGVLRSRQLLNAWCSGVKTTYTVTTDTGRVVRASAIHPFKTRNGWTELRALRPGDDVLVKGVQSQGGRKPKDRYASIRLANHPFRTGKKRLVAVHRLVAEARENGLTYDSWVSVIRSGTDLSGFRFLGRDAHVHHKDHDHTNNDPGNLEVLSVAEHHRHHATAGKADHVLFKTAWETIVSIEEFGEEATYDLELKTDPHNFVANGFVVHNTGKSALVLTIALRVGVPVLYFSADSDAFQQLARSICVLAGVSFDEARRAVLHDDLSRYEAALADIPIRFVFDASPTLDTIEANVEAYEEVYGEYPHLVVVDNISDVMTGGEQKAEERHDELLGYLHGMARQIEACVIGLHHVTGPFNDSDKPVPMSGVKGQLGRVPELILTLFKPSPDTLGVSMPKARGAKPDASGRSFVELDFDGARMQIRDQTGYQPVIPATPWPSDAEPPAHGQGAVDPWS